MSASPSRLWQRLQAEGRLPIGELAVARGLLTGGRLAEALQEQRARPRPLGRILLEKGWIAADALGALLAEQESLCGADPRVPKAGRFLLLRELGRGGMGVVWEAWDPQIGRRVAVKSLAIDDEDARERIVREARAAGQVQHPGIVPVYEVAVHDGRPCIAMALVEGKAVVPGDPSIGARRAAEIVRDAARAVQAAHEKGIIHRDLKPSNLAIDQAGRVFVLDFGLAVVEREASRTATGVIAGTPAYMAPEQALARRDLMGPRTDVYGLGATLYALLAGHAPFVGLQDVQLIHAVPTLEPAPLTSVARDLDTIVRKAMEKAPSTRYESAGALADDLDRFLRAEPILARPTSATWRFVRRHRKPISATAMAGVVVVAIVLLLMRARTAESGLDRRAKAGFIFEEGRRHYEDARLILYRRDAAMHHLAHAAAAAHDALGRAAEADRTYAEPPHYIGRTLMLQGKFPEAEASFTESIRRQPGYAPAHLDRGWCRLVRILLMEVAGKKREAELRALAERDFDRFITLGGEPQHVALSRVAIAWLQDEAKAAERCGELQKDPRIADDAFLLEAIIRFAKGEWGLAAVAAAESVNRRWLDIPARQVLGLSLVKAGKAEAAVMTLRQLVEIFEESPQGWALLGNALSTLGRAEEAERALKRSIELGPEFAAPRVVLGFLRLRQGRAADAVAEFEGAVGLPDAGGINAREGLGEALVALGRLDEAMREFEAARCAEGKARVLRAKGDREGALAVLEGLSSTTARALRAQYRMELRRFDGVEEDLREAIKAEPWRDDVWLLMADLHFYVKRPDLGVGAVEEALARTPGAPRLLTARAERLRILKRLEEARSDIEASLAREGSVASSHRVHARVMHDLRKPEEALAAAERAVKLDRSAESHYVRGLVRLERQPAEGLRDFEETVRLDPNHTDGWMHIAFEEAKKGRLAEASTAYESTLRADPAHGEAALNLGICRTGMGQYAEAAAALERAVKLLPQDARPWKQLGTVYLSLERRREAAEAYERAVRIDPSLEGELRPWIKKARGE